MDKKRRNFLKTTGGVVGIGLLAGSVGSVMTSCEQDEVVSLPPPKTYDIDLSGYPDLNNVGGMAQFEIQLTDDNGDPAGEVTVSVRRMSDSDFLVLDSICRHQNCIVMLPAQPTGELLCPCHAAKFSFEDGQFVPGSFSETVPDLIEYEVYEYDQANSVLKVII